MHPDEHPEQSRKKPTAASAYGSSVREAGPYFTLGIEITISMVLFVLMGYFADNWLGTGPWLLMLGILLSAVATGLTLYRVVRKMDQESAAKKARKTGEVAREEQGVNPDDPSA